MSNNESSFEYKPIETEICGLSIHSNTSSEQMFYSPIQEVNESQTNIIEDSLNNIKMNKKQKDLNQNGDYNSLESIRISHSTFSHENNSILENKLINPLSKFNHKTSQIDLLSNQENLNFNIYKTPKKKNKIENLEYNEEIKNKNIYKFNNVELIPDVFKNSETNKKVMVSELDIKLSSSTAKPNINNNNIPSIKGRVLEDDFKAQLEQNLKEFFTKKAKNKNNEEKNIFNKKISNTYYNENISKTQRECSKKTKSFYNNIDINNKNNTHRNKNNSNNQKGKLNFKKNNYSLYKTKTTTNKQNNKTKKIYNNIKRVNSSKGIHSLIKKITSINNKFNLTNKNLLFKNITENKNNNNNNINKTRNSTLNKISIENKSIKKKGSSHSNNSLTNCSSNKNSNKNSDKYAISTKLSSNKNNKNNDIIHKKITPFSCKNELKTVKYFHQNKNLHNNILNKNIEINFSNISKNSKKYENSYRQSSVNSQKNSNEDQNKSKDTEEELYADIIPDLKNIDFENKQILLCYDADLWEKPQVKQALYQFAAFLISEKRAIVKVILLPKDGPKGIDDFLIANGVEEAKKLLIDGVVEVKGTVSVDTAQAVSAKGFSGSLTTLSTLGYEIVLKLENCVYQGGNVDINIQTKFVNR